MRLRILFLLLVVLPLTVAKAAHADHEIDSLNLKGQFLVAAPTMGDPRFAETVILIIDHDDGGAIGLIVNRALGVGPLNSFLQGLGIEATEEGENVKTEDMRLHFGGPVEGGALFVIHSRDVTMPTSNLVLDDVAVTTNREMLNRLARGQGPKRYLIVLGYAGWGAGQLENEMKHNDWVLAPAEADLIFDAKPETVWETVFKGAGLAL